MNMPSSSSETAEDNFLYSLSHHASRNALNIAIEGFWNLETFFDFQRDVSGYARRLTLGGRRHLVLVNVSKIAIQTQEVIQYFRVLLETEQPRPGKIAFVAATALSRMQTRRLLVRDTVRLFEDLSSAERWLDQAEA